MNEVLTVGQEVWFFICFHENSSQQAVHLEDFYLSKGRVNSVYSVLGEATEYVLQDEDGEDLIYKAHETQVYQSYDEAMEHLMERVKK